MQVIIRAFYWQNRGNSCKVCPDVICGRQKSRPVESVSLYSIAVEQ